jgi:hypothetical protein
MRTMKNKPPSMIGSTDLADCLMASEILHSSGGGRRIGREGGPVVVGIDVCRGEDLLNHTPQSWWRRERERGEERELREGKRGRPGMYLRELSSTGRR